MTKRGALALVLAIAACAIEACEEAPAAPTFTEREPVSVGGSCGDANKAWTGPAYDPNRFFCTHACELRNRNANAQADQQCEELAALLTRGPYNTGQVCSAACGGSGDYRPEPQTGQVVFWTDATRGWRRIEIQVDAQHVGTLTQYLRSKPTRCDTHDSARVVITRRPGTYTVTARDSVTNARWPAHQTTIVAGGCHPYRLHCGPDKDCSN